MNDTEHAALAALAQEWRRKAQAAESQPKVYAAWLTCCKQLEAALAGAAPGAEFDEIPPMGMDASNCAGPAPSEPQPPCPACVSERGKADPACRYCGGSGRCHPASPSQRTGSTCERLSHER